MFYPPSMKIVDVSLRRVTAEDEVKSAISFCLSVFHFLQDVAYRYILSFMQLQKCQLEESIAHITDTMCQPIL